LKNSFNPNEYDLSISMMRTTGQDITISGGTHPGCLAHMKKMGRTLDKFEILTEKNSFQSAKKVIAHSNLIRDEIEKYYQIPDNKIIRLFPPINTQLFNGRAKERAAEAAAKYSINQNRITLLFPSTGHKRKGLDELLLAMRLLPQDDYELLIAGTPIDLPQSNIRSLGFVDDMPALYAAVDFTILPSHYEPFGLIVPESVACGTPVIISPFVGAKDIITENEGLVLSDISADAIAETIKQAVSKNFNIKDDFAERNQLTLKQHVVSLKSVV